MRSFWQIAAGALLFVAGFWTVCGCRKSQEFRLENELKPTTERELVEMSDGNLERVDIARINLICARAAFQGKGPEIEDCLKQLDDWAQCIKRAETSYRRVYERMPAKYDYSYAKFRAVNLVLTLKEDFNCRYQKSLIDSGDMDDICSPRFFRNPDDVFITGLLRCRRGTCSSYPVLIAALGRRLGYPIYLKRTYGHLFCLWDDGVETFNIDTNGEGVDTPSDAYYFSERTQRQGGKTPTDLANDRVMIKLTARDVLSVFLETAGYSLEAQGALPSAQAHYLAALKFRPNCENLRRLTMRCIRAVSAP